MSAAAGATRRGLICLPDPDGRAMALPAEPDGAQIVPERPKWRRPLLLTNGSDHIESELVEHMSLDRLGLLADQVNLAVRTATMVKTDDVTVGWRPGVGAYAKKRTKRTRHGQEEPAR
jgi:hypothetical protein